MTTQSPSLDWDDLRFFLHVARAGSLTAAAQTMGVSHATAFRRLQRLESDLGVLLFARTRAGYALTSAGEDLLQVATAMELELQSTARRLGSRDAWPGGMVRVTTTDTLMHQMLPPILVAYQRQAGVQLQLSTSNTMQDIAKGQSDVAIRAGGRPPDPLVGRRLCRVEATVYRARTLRGVNPNNWGSCPWIGVDDNLSHLASAQWLHQQGLDPMAVLRTNSLVNVLHLVRCGTALAVLPCYLGDADSSLQRVIDPPIAFRSDLWLLTRSELRTVPRIKKLFDAVYEGTRPLVALFEGLAGVA